MKRLEKHRRPTEYGVFLHNRVAQQRFAGGIFELYDEGVQMQNKTFIDNLFSHHACKNIK